MDKHSAGPWEIDSAKDGDSRYQVIHGQVPKGINGDFGYPVADTMNSVAIPAGSAALASRRCFE